MAKFDVEIEGKIFEVEAENEKDLPEIVDTISQQERVDFGESLVQERGGFRSGLRNVLLGGKIKVPFLKDRVGLPPPLEIPRQILFGKPREDVGQERLRAATKGLISTRTFGLPQAIQALAGIEPEAVRTKAPVIETFGEIAGFGGIFGVAKKAASIVKGTRLSAKVLRGAVTGGVAGLITPPDEEFINLPKRTQQALIGSSVGAVAATAGGIISNVRKASTQSANFAQKIRGQFFQTKRNAIQKFGDQLDELSIKNPNKTISLRSRVEELIEDIKLNPKLRSVVNRTPKLKKLVDNPSLANEVRLKDVQEISNGLRSKISFTKLTGRGRITSDDLPIFDLVDDVRAAQLDAFPQMEGIRAEYAKILGPYNQIKNKIKVGNLISSIRINFGDREVQGLVKQLLPPETIKELGGVRKAMKFLEAAGWFGRRAVATGIAIEAGRRIFKSRD